MKIGKYSISVRKGTERLIGVAFDSGTFPEDELGTHHYADIVIGFWWPVCIYIDWIEVA